MHLFYSKNIQENNIILPEDESLHAVKVLRLTEKEHVGVIDGKGNFFLCTIEKAHSKKCDLKIVEKKSFQKSRNKFVHVAIAPTKNSDRIEWFVEKAVEMGIDKISFLHCEHSERKSMNMDRTERVVLSAMKQSQQYFQPELEDMLKFSQFVEKYKETEHKYIAHLEEGDRTDFSKAIQNKENVLILIGPEGDFSKAEVEVAIKNNFLPVTLGQNRLRTETAGLYAVAVSNAL
ncbi:MAG: 16S rRNA (uracil(1498)-N(3))-methyltransferase [Cytophagales bacterium]